MEERVLGRTERPVSVIGLGTWQLGADWGEVSETAALEVLGAAVESGVTFVDTADVYGDGRSERLIGRFRAANPELSIMVATKMGSESIRFRRTSRSRTSEHGPSGRAAIWTWINLILSSCTVHQRLCTLEIRSTTHWTRLWLTE
jgi:aryl-alcohol dehydrogenase-like predicted oxidoreductase